MNLELQIVLALLLDSMFGDPRWLPHPVRLIGMVAVQCENFFRAIIGNEKAAGIVTLLAVLALTGLCGWGLIRLSDLVHPWLGMAVSVLLLYTCFAARDLIAHSNNVHQALQKEDISLARRQVSMIVGRETQQLDKGGVVRACVESVAENTVDGVTAPLFWAVVGGPLGALLYKTVNTMDSTFGYKNERYVHFGWAAARFDDLVNWLPARVTGIFMVAAAKILGLAAADGWRILRRDRKNHASPNSGQSEAAMAGILGIQLGGASCYFGELLTKPTLGDDLHEPEPAHICRANRVLIVTTALMALCMLMVRYGVEVGMTGL